MLETELHQYISHKRCEDPVYEAVMTRVKRDVEKRKSRLAGLMENVKLE